MTRAWHFAFGGGLLVLAAVFGAGLVPAPRLPAWLERPLQPRETPVAVDTLQEAGFAFAPRAATRYALADDDGEIGFLQVAYTDAAGVARTALLHPPPVAGSEAAETRWTWWQQTAASIRKYAEPSVRVVAWWDNGQRARLLTGLAVWSDAPTATLFGDGERPFWRKVAGGFADDPRPLRELARWLTNPAEEAVAALRAAAGSASLLILSSDDLARAQEIAAAGGKRLPVESKVFPTSTNLHGTINSVRRWAQEGGTGSYLVQPLPGQRVRAWRVTDAQALDWLLIRALPFSTSLYRPIDGAELVYQSGGGGYLNVYRIRAPTTAPRPAAAR